MLGGLRITGSGLGTPLRAPTSPAAQLQLPGSSVWLLAGLELPSLTCGLETFPVKEDAGKSQGILALNVKSIKILEKPWMRPSRRSQEGRRNLRGEPGLFQRAEKTRACPVL